MASATEEDLDINPFYLALQTKFKKKFEEAQENCFLIFIPKSESLVGHTINKKFMETHIMKPSPYFQGQYVTTDKNRSKCIRFEENKIRTLEGFKESSIFEIISEELGYSKTLKPYRIIIIERPFNSSLFTPQSSMPRSDSCIDFDKFLSSYLECKKFLFMFPEHKSILSSLEDHISMYKSNYVFIPSFIEEDIKKLRRIYDEITENLLKIRKNIQKSDHRSDSMVKIAVESVMFKDIYPKLFPVISKRFMTEDEDITSKIQEEKYITPETLNVRHDFCSSFTLSIKELSNLDNCETPLEKLACLKNTLDLISKEVMDHLKINPIYFWKDLPSLTADDLIPLLVIIITKSKPQYLFSNIYYIENCHWSTSNKDDYGFSLITFKATQEFIRNTNFKVLYGKREMHLKTLSTSTEKSISVDDSLLLPSKIDQECNQEKNSKDFQFEEKKLEKSNSLGDFLSALQQNTFGFGFGKQT